MPSLWDTVESREASKMLPKIGSNYHAKPVHRRDPTGRHQAIEDPDAKFDISEADYLVLLAIVIAVGFVYWWMK